MQADNAGCDAINYNASIRREHATRYSTIIDVVGAERPPCSGVGKTNVHIATLAFLNVEMHVSCHVNYQFNVIYLSIDPSSDLVESRSKSSRIYSTQLQFVIFQGRSAFDSNSN